MAGQDQWIITVVAEGSCNPFDIVSDFLENLRIQGDYDVISMAITPASGISGGSADNHDGGTSGDNYHNDTACFCGRTHDVPRSFGAILDGYEPAVYAGISVSRGVR